METYDISAVSRMTGLSKPVIYEYVQRLRDHFPGLMRGRCNSLIFTAADVEFILEIRRKNKVCEASIGTIKGELADGHREDWRFARMMEIAEVMAIRMATQDIAIDAMKAEQVQIRDEIFGLKMMLASKMTEDREMRLKVETVMERLAADRGLEGNAASDSFVARVARTLTSMILPRQHLNTL